MISMLNREFTVQMQLWMVAETSTRSCQTWLCPNSTLTRRRTPQHRATFNLLSPQLPNRSAIRQLGNILHNKTMVDVLMTSPRLESLAKEFIWIRPTWTTRWCTLLKTSSKWDLQSKTYHHLVWVWSSLRLATLTTWAAIHSIQSARLEDNLDIWKICQMPMKHTFQISSLALKAQKVRIQICIPALIRVVKVRLSTRLRNTLKIRDKA